MAEGRAEGRYKALVTDREPYLRRARKASEITIPSLIPPDGWDGSQELYTPYQGVGARGVRSISAKLTTATLPANSPFFRMQPDEQALEELQETNPGVKTDTEKKLAKYERTVMRKIEASGDRSTVDETMKHLVVGGNACLDMTRKQSRLIGLSHYVVVRDPRGQPVEAVIREGFKKASAPENVQGLIADAGEDDTIYVYTHIELKKDGFYHLYQEVSGKAVKGSKGKYKQDRLPYLFLRFTRIDGEDYGRGFLEEVYGDLSSLEALSEAIVQGSAAAAKVLFLVNPNGTTRVKALRDTKNLGFAEGNDEDVSVLHMDKQGDFSVAAQTAERIERRLEEQFMLHSAVQRDAERVTAEEIRYLAQELDVNLSGIYSILAVEFQLPYVNQKIRILEKGKEINKLPEDVVEPVIITGLQALGRSQDLERLRVFLKELIEVIGPEQAASVIDFRIVADRFATALQIDTDELLKSEEQVQQDKQMAQLQNFIQQAGPGALQELVKNGTAQQAVQQAAGGGSGAAGTGSGPAGSGGSGSPQGGQAAG